MLIVQKCYVKPLRAALHAPFRISTGQHDILDNLLFVVCLSKGISGYGEAAVATHITGETLAGTEAVLHRVEQWLTGKDITDILKVLWQIREMCLGQNAALAAIEMAVLDAFTRAFHIPLWRFFGPQPARLVTDMTIVIGSLQEAEAHVKEFTRRGFKTFKIKIGKNPEEDMLRVRAVRTVAPQARIILDANQGFTAETMLSFVRQLRKVDVVPVLLEQPVAKNDIGGLTKLTRLARIPVCADESAGSLADVVRLLHCRAVNAINVKLMKNGLLEGAAITRLARAAGVKIMMGAMMESSLAITAAAHVAAGLGCFDFVDLDTTFFIKGPLARAPYLDAGGRFDLSQATPGIGVRVAYK